MIKLAIGFCALFIGYSKPLDLRFYSPSVYSEELKAALNDFKSEVKFVINEARTVETEYEQLLETLHSSATYIQKEVSDGVNNTMAGFNTQVNSLLTDTSIYVNECMALRSTIESTMTDILSSTNICVHDKLNEAQVYVEESILSTEYILERLKSLENIADDNFSKIMKSKDLKTVFETEIFFKSVSTESSKVAAKILSTLTDTTLVISQIDNLMISDCVSNEAMSSLVNDTQLLYSKIKTCIADLNSSDADLQTLFASS